ncbi:MAG: hypothetical protein ACSHWP_00090 [Pseudoalteromonas sp.]
MPAAFIKAQLSINKIYCPQGSINIGETGWSFGIIVRYLEDENRLLYKKLETRHLVNV